MIVDKIACRITNREEPAKTRREVSSSSSSKKPKASYSKDKTTEMPSVVDNLKQMIARGRGANDNDDEGDDDEETNRRGEANGRLAASPGALNEANDEENIVIDMEDEDDDDDEAEGEHEQDEQLSHYASSSAKLSSSSPHAANKQQPAGFQIGQLIWFDPNQLNYSIPGKIVDFYPELNVLTVEGCGQPLSLEDSQLDDLSRNRLLLKADTELQLYELSDQQAFRSIKVREPISSELAFDNLLGLDELSLESIIYNLKLRQKQELVYTKCGHKILISLNPFKQLCNLYNLDQVNRFNSITLEKLDRLTKFNCLNGQREALGAAALSPPPPAHSAPNSNSTLIKWLILNEQNRNSSTIAGGDFSASQTTNSQANPSCEPHIFQLANEALKKLLVNCQDQCFILLGDSGSGKTESCKLLVQYFATVNRAPTNLITEQILESIQVLESFGNARTVLNDNSSRFGKLLDLRFNLRNGFILDAKTVDLNLLDRSRIVCQNENERNYHIFYELLAGLNRNEKEKYGLQTAEKYFYLNQGQCMDLQHKDDGLDFRSLLASMQVLGFNYKEQDTIFRILASILHLGNIYFHRKVLAIRSSKVSVANNNNNNGQQQPPPPVAQQSVAGIEGVEIGSDTEVRWVSHLLQVQFDLVMRCLTVRTTPETIHHQPQHNNQPANHQSSVGFEHPTTATIVTPLNIDQALDTRDAIARALYTCLFKWLVQRINVMINSSGQSEETPDRDDESIDRQHQQQQTKSDNNQRHSQIGREPIYMCKTSESLCEFQPDKMAAQSNFDRGHYSGSSRAGSGSRRSRPAQNDGYSPINNSNQQLKLQRSATISILDAFGFENLGENNFEQLCINYAAELINYHTNRYLSRLEQAEYVRERLRWQPIGQKWTKLQQRQQHAQNSSSNNNTADSQHQQQTFSSNSLTSTSSSQATFNRAPASIVNLISRKPLGILALLDDECNFPKATDQSFAEKCHHNHALNENYQCARLAANCQEFGIRHFRQANRMVWYQVDGFVEKNRDSLRPDVVELLVDSKMSIVADMLRKTHRSADSNGSNTKTLSRTFDGRYVSMKPRATTVATRFQDTIHHNKVMDTLTGAAAPSSLLAPASSNQHYANAGGDSSLASSFRSSSKQRQQQLQQQVNPQAQSANAWFIICLKPNRSKTAQVFDVPYVQEQVKSINLLEIVQMRRFGYPVRLRYNEFVRRFKCLVPSEFLNNLTAPTGQPDKSRPKGKQSGIKQQQSMKKAIRDVCSSIVEYKFHHHFSATPAAMDAVKRQYQCGLTKMFLNEKLFHQLEAWRLAEYQNAIEVLQKNLRMWLCRRDYLAARQAATLVQAHWRAYLARKSFWRQYSLIVALQRRWRQVSHVRRRQKLEARRRALKQEEAFRLQELKEQQRKQANQFRFRLNVNKQQQSNDHYQALRGLLEIPEDLTQLYRLQKNWQPAHDLSNVKQFNLVDLAEKELTRQRRHKPNAAQSVPFVVINDELRSTRRTSSSSSETNTMPTKHQQVVDYIEQLELDERYSLHNFLSKYYTSEAPQFGYSRLPITRPFTWSKLMRLKQLELHKRKLMQQQLAERLKLDGENTTVDEDEPGQFAYRQEAKLIRRRFTAIEQKSVAIYKLILRYIDSDQSLPASQGGDNESEKYNLEKDPHKHQELVQKLLKFKLISDYINYLCLTEPRLRNEVYLQLCSQSWQHPKLRSVENTWKLFLNCLSCFRPIGLDFNKFLLKYANDFCCDRYRKLICTKLWQNLTSLESQRNDETTARRPTTTSKQRRYPTTIIEYWANQLGVEHLAISASCYMDDHALTEQATTTSVHHSADHPDENGNDQLSQSHLNLTNFANKTLVQLDSHTTAEQFARDLLTSRSIPDTNLAGWSIEIQHEGALSEHSSRLRGDDQLLDHFARLELLPELVQLIDDDFEAFECEQLDLMFGLGTTAAAASGESASPHSEEPTMLAADQQPVGGYRSPPTMSPTGYGRTPHQSVRNPRLSGGNYSQYSYGNPDHRRPLSSSQYQNRRHSAAMSADYDAYSQRTARESRHFAAQGPPVWQQPLDQHGFDDDFYHQQQQQQQHYRASSSLSNQRKLSRRSMSMQELQLASSALNGRYFGHQQQPYSQAPSHHSPNSPPDCCRNSGQAHHHHHQLGPPLLPPLPFPSNRRLSGSLRQLEMSPPMNMVQPPTNRRRSGTPNSTTAASGGYQSAPSRAGHRLSSSAYGTTSTQNSSSNAQHYQQVHDSNEENGENINRELLAPRQQARFARQYEQFNMMNDQNRPKRRSASSSSRTAAGPTSDYASTAHNSDYERIATNAHQRLRPTGSGSPNKFRPPPQPLQLQQLKQQAMSNNPNLSRQQQQLQLVQQQRQLRPRGEWDSSLGGNRHAPGRRLPPSSDCGNQANIHYATSSAMSDTSEAPSLASHVRAVKVPQPNGDLDRYLDDLFNPLLDEVDLDDLSDARSLATSIRGRQEVKEAGETGDLLANLCDPLALSRMIRGRSADQEPTSAQAPDETRLIERNQELNRMSRADLSPTFESLLRSLKPKDDLMSPTTTTATTTSDDNPQPANLDKLSLSELKALNERLESQIQAAQSARPALELTGSGSNIPIPPPLPSFNQSDAISCPAAAVAASTPFDDAYSRAKTIRIGKWRWPPAREEAEQLPASGGDRKRASLLDHQELNAQSDQCADDPNVPVDGYDGRVSPQKAAAPESETTMTSENQQQQQAGGSSTSDAAQNQSNAVGRLKISSEMKAKLEQLTNTSGNVAVAGQTSSSGIVSQAKDLLESSKSSQVADQPRRLNEQRRNLLEIQLLGSSNNSKQIPPSQETAGRAIKSPTTDDNNTAERQLSRHSSGSSENSPTSPSGSKVLAVKQKLAAAAGVALASLDCNSGASSQASSRRQSSNTFGPMQTTSGANQDDGDDDKSQPTTDNPNGDQQADAQRGRSARHLHNDELGPQTRAAISQRQSFYRISASSDRLDRLLSEPTGPGQMKASHHNQLHGGSSEVQLSTTQTSGEFGMDEEETARRQFGPGGGGGLQQAQLLRATPIASDLNEAGRASAGAGAEGCRGNSSMIERLCGKLTLSSGQYGRPTGRGGKPFPASNLQDSNQWISTSCSPPVQPDDHTTTAAKTTTNKMTSNEFESSKRTQAKQQTATPKQAHPTPAKPKVSANCLSHANVDWQVRIRKEVFRPSESYDDPLVMQLVFAQLVADVFNPRHWTRLNNKERAAMKSMMKDNSIGYSPSLPPIGHMQPVKRDLIKMARSFGLYFTRSYQALNFVCLSEGQLESLPLPLVRRNRANSNSGGYDDNAEMSSSSSSSSAENSSEEDGDQLAGEHDKREERNSVQMARKLYQSGGLGLDWIDLVAVHHSGLRLVSMVDNSVGTQQQQATLHNHQIESQPGIAHNVNVGGGGGPTTAPPIGYKVLETLKFRDMTSVSLLCKQKLVLVNMRNGRRSWLLSSSQASQLASLLKSFHLDYNEQVRSTSNQVVNSTASSLRQENHNNPAADVGGGKRTKQQQSSAANKQQVAGTNEAKTNNKARATRSKQQQQHNATIGQQLQEDKENALLATDDDHHGDHLEQRQTPNCLHELRPAAHPNNVLADRGRVLPNNLASSSSPSHRNQPARANEHRRPLSAESSSSASSSSPSASPPRLPWGADGVGSCRKCGLSRQPAPGGGPKSDQQLQPVCSCKLDAHHGGGGGLHAGGRGNGGQLQQQSPQPKSKLSPDSSPAADSQQQQQQQPTDSNSLEAAQQHQQATSQEAQKQSRKKLKKSSNSTTTTSNHHKQTPNSISGWQNSLSRMSNKLNIFSNSSKRKPANDEQQAAESAGQSDSGAASTANKTGEHEQVVLDAWIETKVDFDEENDEDSGDEQRQLSLLQDDDDQHHQDDEQQQQAASTRRAGSTIESGSLSQLKLKQQQSKTSQSSTANNNNYNEPAPAKPDDGKYSMLQFALYNFREAIEKYSLAQKAKQRQSNERDAHAGDTSTLRGSLKLIEFLRDGGSADATAPASHSTTTSSSSSSTSANGQQQQAPSSKHDWTWRELAEMVKFTQNPIKRSLLKLPSNQDELERRAVECFAAIMQYMGDLPLANNSKQSGEVQCVYLILINCHNYPILRDEIYCQLVKQTTNNRSQRSSDSCLLGWRLFSIVAAYFDCSQMFKPYLMKYLEQAAYDKRRAYHSMASLCLQNLRKTFKFKGRKNVPSIEEIAATTAGRNSKRQIYRLPGGTERVINTNSTTVVDDIIHEICSNMLNVNEPDEMLEYSLYCIADGDLYTMPLNRDEYILDITTELIKNHQQYFLIFCRSIWHYPLRLDSQLYIEVIFNQIAPDYLEGLLLILPKQQQQQEKIYGNPKMMVPSSAGSHSSHSDGAPSHPLGQRKSNHHDVGPFRLKMKLVREIARLAALLHRAYGSDYIPHKDEIKYLLPKTIVSLLKQQQRILTSERLSSASSINSNSSSSNSTGGKLDDHPAAAGAASAKNQQHQIVVSSQKWIDLVQENCRELNAIDSLDAKAQFLDIVRHWPLFGSSFFAIKLIQRDLIQPMDFILALNKLGVQMLDTQTHETIHRYQFNEVISTRKVRSEDGALFLDMKCGNLMKRTIIRIQTDQAHEISRLIRQYIDIEISQANKTSAPSNQRRITAGGQQVEQQQHQFEPA